MKSWLRNAARLKLGLGACALIACASSCSNSKSAPPAPGTTAGSGAPVMPAAEWVSFHTEIPFAATDFHGLASGLFGADAQSGKYVASKEIVPGIKISSAADPSTPEQSRITLTFDDGSTTRTMAVVPASFAVGNVFVTTVDAAVAQMQQAIATKQTSGDSFLLQYQVTSTQGGTFQFSVHAVEGVFTLMLDVSSPATALAQGSIGKPVSSADPYDTINGTVWFSLTRDDFDYFAHHAYGADATAAQNFDDFALVPHNWLRLTVTPHLDQQYVNVGFQVLGLDGTRTPLAAAPASVFAGGLFQSMVDRNLTTMAAQEKAKVGSSTPWTVPFYYNSPDNSGVVQVVAQGAAGKFNIAYAVQAPLHTIKDVPFLEYPPAPPPPDASAPAACDQTGNAGIVAASHGAFAITFAASDQVKNSPDLKGPLKGTIYCSVYNATDVDVTGPKAGTMSLQDFNIPNADFGAMKPPTYLTAAFPDGAYQILCFQDLAHNGMPTKGDPVTLPIGNFPIACNVNPVTVQFALLDPQNN
jgi:hypothetical protein